MKKRISWGTGITISLILIVLFLTAITVYFMNKDVELVETGYYEKELEYQGKIDKINNVNNLTGKIFIQHVKDDVVIVFPNDDDLNKISGEILFYRPDSHSKDFKKTFDISERRTVFIKVPELQSGAWKVKIVFNGITKEYYSEQNLIVK